MEAPYPLKQALKIQPAIFVYILLKREETAAHRHKTRVRRPGVGLEPRSSGDLYSARQRESRSASLVPYSLLYSILSGTDNQIKSSIAN